MQKYLFILMLSWCLAGCVTDKTSRADAVTVLEKLKGYKAEQTSRVAKLRADYGDTSTRLLTEYTQAMQKWVKNERTLDEQRVADELVADWQRQTLPTAVYDDVSGVRSRQLARLQEAREAIAAARKSFATSFAQTSLQLQKLDAAIKSIEPLTEEGNQLEASFAALRKEVEEAVEAIEKKRKEEAEKKAGGGGA